MSNSINQVWLKMIHDITVFGHETSPRGRRTRELIGHQVILDMRRSVLTFTERKLGYKFLCAAAAWILSGDDRVETIAPYSKTVARFSDDGRVFFGAYGPKIVAQLDYVIETLTRDPDSRQAVINIWRENPPLVKDVPCTLSYQFVIRNGQLDVITTMRSNDAWLGFVYDAFDASMLACYVLLLLPPYRLGDLYHTAGSRHLYESDWEGVERCLQNPTTLFDYAPLNPAVFGAETELIEHLWALARRTEVKRPFLREVLDL